MYLENMHLGLEGVPIYRYLKAKVYPLPVHGALGLVRPKNPKSPTNTNDPKT